MRGRIGTAIALALLGVTGAASAQSRAPMTPRYTFVQYPAVPARYDGMLTVDPGARGVLYVGEAWSRDGGATWAASPILADADDHAVGFATLRRVVYRVDGDSNVSRSTDGGRTWVIRSTIPAGLQDEYQYGSVTVEPYGTNVVCLQGDQAILSSDGGATWHASPECRSIAATDARTLVAWVSAGIAASTDGGATWSPRGAAPPGDSGAITSDPTTPGSVYAFNNEPSSSHSADGGTTWTPITDPAEGLNELVDPVRRGVVVAYWLGRLWVSRDYGSTWTLTPRRLTAAPTGFDAAGALYVLGSSPMRSADDGMTWTWKGHGLAGVRATGLAVDAVTGAVYMTTSGGVLRLGADGKTWRSVSPFQLGPYSGTAPLVAASGALLIGVGDGRVVRSTNGGVSFAEVDSAHLPDASYGTAPVAGIGKTRTIVGTSIDGSARRSDDAGVTWTDIARPGDTTGSALVVAQPHGGTPATLFQASITDAGRAWMRSLDLGASWQPYLTTAGTASMVAATAKAEYFTGFLSAHAGSYPPGGFAVAPRGGAPRQLRLFSKITVQLVVTSYAHPALVVALGVDSGDGVPEDFVTRDAGKTWKRLASLPGYGTCSVVGAALTPDDRLIAVLSPACRVASLVSSPLDH